MYGRGRRGGSPAPTQGGGRGRGRGAPLPSPMASSEAGSISSVSQLGGEMERLSVQTEPPASTQPAAIPAPQQQKQQQQLVPASSVKFAQRPDHGTVGSRCLIRANHFLVELADRDLHHYDVMLTFFVLYSSSFLLIISVPVWFARKCMEENIQGSFCV